MMLFYGQLRPGNLIVNLEQFNAVVLCESIFIKVIIRVFYFFHPALKTPLRSIHFSTFLSAKPENPDIILLLPLSVKRYILQGYKAGLDNKIKFLNLAESFLAYLFINLDKHHCFMVGFVSTQLHGSDINIFIAQ